MIYLKKGRVYVVNCGLCDKVYLGETGRLQRFREYKKGEDNRIPNSLS